MQIHYFAAARAAAGCAQEEISLSSLAEPTLACLLEQLGQTHKGRTASGMAFATVLGKCSFLLNGSSAQPTASLSEQDRLDVLPPFAGG